MKFPRLPHIPKLNPYYAGSAALVAAAAVQLVVAVLADRRDLTSAGLVISATVCLITGIFLAILSTSEPLDTRYVSRLPVQGCINLCRVAADLGIQGSGYFLPPGRDGRTRTHLFLPVASLEKIPQAGESFAFGPGSAGMLVEPSGASLYAEIRNRENMVIPSDIPAILSLLKETGEDVLEVSDKVTAEMSGDTVTVTMENFRLIEGCTAMQAESPRCCQMVPCPVCSVFGTILAEGQGTIVTLERCIPDAGKKSVTAVFTLLPGDDGQPEVQVPVT